MTIPKSPSTQDWKYYLKQLEDTLELYLVKKAPALPENVKETIVKFAPWITLILIILALPAILAIFGLSALVMPFSYLGGFRYGLNYTLTIVVSAVVLIIEAIAIPGLMKRSKSAWNLVYYATLIGAIQNLISFNIGALVIGTLLSLYVLFQVKSYYK